MQGIDSIEYKGHTINICPDEDAPNPRKNSTTSAPWFASIVAMILATGTSSEIPMNSRHS